MKNKSQKLYSKIIATALLAGTVLLPTTAGASVSTTTTKQAVTNNAVAALPGLVTVASGDTSSLDTSKITFVNNVGKTDEIKGSAGSVPSKAAVKIYASSADTVAIATGTASADGSFTAKGATAVLPSVKATLYITTKVGKDAESAKTPFDYTSDNFEKTTTAPTGDIVVENTLKKDIVTVKGLEKGDVVKVYADDQRTLLGTAKAAVPKGATVAEAKVTLKINLSDDPSQKIWVSVTSNNARESELVPVSLTNSSEPVTTAPTATVLTNNLAPVADTIQVTAVEKDTVKVYAQMPIGTDGLFSYTVLLGSAVIATGKTSADIKLKTQVPDKARLYATATAKDNQESAPLLIDWVDVAKTTVITPDTVTLDTKTGKKLTVAGVEAGATVNVYADDQRTLLGSKKAGKAVGPVDVGFKVVLPAVDGETIYVTFTVAGKKESDLVEYKYDGKDWKYEGVVSY